MQRKTWILKRISPRYPFNVLFRSLWLIISFQKAQSLASRFFCLFWGISLIAKGLERKERKETRAEKVRCYIQQGSSGQELNFGRCSHVPWTVQFANQTGSPQYNWRINGQKIYSHIFWKVYYVDSALFQVTAMGGGGGTLKPQRWKYSMDTFIIYGVRGISELMFLRMRRRSTAHRCRLSSACWVFLNFYFKLEIGIFCEWHLASSTKTCFCFSIGQIPQRKMFFFKSWMVEVNPLTRIYHTNKLLWTVT